MYYSGYQKGTNYEVIIHQNLSQDRGADFMHRDIKLFKYRRMHG